MTRVGSVYFIQAENGPIKIGYTKAPIKDRISNLQISSPVELRILSVIAGSERLESNLHLTFSHLKIRGEWFRPGADLLALIQKSKESTTRLLPMGRRGPHRKDLVVRQPNLSAQVFQALTAAPNRHWTTWGVCKKIGRPRHFKGMVYRALYALWRANKILRDATGRFHDFEIGSLKTNER